MKNKMKSKKAATKRLRVTSSGTLKRKQCGRNHLAGAKTKKQRRHLSKQTVVSKSDQSRISQLFQG